MAFKFPSIWTSLVRVCTEMPAQNMIEPPRYWSTSTKQHSTFLSPRLRYTRERPSLPCKEIRVSSTNKTLAQSACVSRMWCRAQAKRAARCLTDNLKTFRGRLARNSTSLRRFRTVCELMARLWFPTFTRAVASAVWSRFRRWETTMCRSCLLDVTLRRGRRRISITLPVRRYLSISCWMVEWCLWNLLATWIKVQIKTVNKT